MLTFLFFTIIFHSLVIAFQFMVRYILVIKILINIIMIIILVFDWGFILFHELENRIKIQLIVRLQNIIDLFYDSLIMYLLQPVVKIQLLFDIQFYLNFDIIMIFIHELLNKYIFAFHMILLHFNLFVKTYLFF